MPKDQSRFSQWTPFQGDGKTVNGCRSATVVTEALCINCRTVGRIGQLSQ